MLHTIGESGDGVQKGGSKNKKNVSRNDSESESIKKKINDPEKQDCIMKYLQNELHVNVQNTNKNVLLGKQDLPSSDSILDVFVFIYPHLSQQGNVRHVFLITGMYLDSKLA